MRMVACKVLTCPAISPGVLKVMRTQAHARAPLPAH
jgi:hypothetical protein